MNNNSSQDCVILLKRNRKIEKWNRIDNLEIETYMYKYLMYAQKSMKEKMDYSINGNKIISMEQWLNLKNTKL